MKFGLVVTNLRGGGAERGMLNLAGLLAARGHDVEMILLEDAIDHGPPSGIAIHTVSPAGRPVGHGWLGKRLAARALRNLWRRLDRQRPFDLIVSTLPFCDEVVRLARLPRVRYRIANTLSAEIGLLEQRSPAKAARRRRRYRELYDGQALIAVSDGVADDLRQRIGLRHADIVRIYNPFDFARIRDLASKPEPDLPLQPYVIHVGRFAPQKRHDLLFAAWREAGLSQRLVLLAEPSDALDRLIAAHGLSDQVTVAGFRRNPYPWIAGADLLVLCSDHEGMPNVLVEAIACGTRVVSTDCPSGPREVLSDGLARFLVPCGDAVALAAAMRAALAEGPPAAATRLADFEAERVAGRYEALATSWRTG